MPSGAGRPSPVLRDAIQDFTSVLLKACALNVIIFSEMVVCLSHIFLRFAFPWSVLSFQHLEASGGSGGPLSSCQCGASGSSLCGGCWAWAAGALSLAALGSWSVFSTFPSGVPGVRTRPLGHELPCLSLPVDSFISLVFRAPHSFFCLDGASRSGRRR